MTALHAAAPLDRSTRLVSAAFSVALIGLAWSMPPARDGGPGTVWAAVPLLLIALAYGFSPAGYRLSPDGRMAVVRRWFGSRTFRVDHAETVSALFGLGGIRLAASGGAFGWYGVFWRKGTGRYRAYVTDRARLVACHGPDGLIVISPEDPDAFVAAVPTP